jgi:death-on-curing protein
VIFLNLEELLYVAARTLGAEPEVRDMGLLESALARPRSSAFAKDAYPTIHEKAAALLHSLVRNHALIDGNKRLALAATIAFYGMNGMSLTLTNDEAYELVVDVASGRLDDVAAIASLLAAGTKTRPTRTHPHHRRR